MKGIMLFEEYIEDKSYNNDEDLLFLVRKYVNEIRNKNENLKLDNVLNSLEKTIRKLGIKTKYSDMKQLNNPERIKGYIHVKDSETSIILRVEDNRKERNITLAYALGEILINGKGTENVLIGHEFYKPMNKLVLEFVKQLLVPNDVLIKVLPEDVKELRVVELDEVENRVSNTFNIPKLLARLVVDECIKKT